MRRTDLIGVDVEDDLLASLLVALLQLEASARLFELLVAEGLLLRRPTLPFGSEPIKVQ